MEDAKRNSRHTIIYHNLIKEDFIREAVNEISKSKDSYLTSDDKKLTLVNILETEYNPEGNPVEEYSFRSSDGLLMTDAYTLYEVFVPNLLAVARGEDFDNSLIVDSFEIIEFEDNEDSNLEDSSNNLSSNFTLTNEYINKSSEEKEPEEKTSDSDITEY